MKSAMINMGFSAVLAAALLAAGCGGSSGRVPAPTTGTVTGQILDDSGDPVAGALVVIGSESWSATTDLLGRFTIPNVTAGTQPVKIVKGGHAIKSGQAAVTAGETTPLGASDTVLAVDSDSSDDPALSNASATASGSGALLTVSGADSNSDIAAVRAASPDLEMSETLNDAGANGDVTAGDGVYSFSVALTAAQNAQLSTWHFFAYDDAGNASAVLTLTYGETDATPISTLTGRTSAGLAASLGQSATIQGVAVVDAGVLSTKKLRIHIMDSTGGIPVQAEEDVAAGLPTIKEGDEIKVTGVIVQEPELDHSVGTISLQVNSAADLTVIDSGNAIPEAVEIAGSNCVSQYQATAGALGGGLATLKAVQLVDASAWPAADSKSDNVDIRDADGNVMTIRIQKNSGIKGTMAPAGAFDLTGLMRQDDLNDDGDFNDSYVIWPRSVDDIVELQTARAGN